MILYGLPTRALAGDVNVDVVVLNGPGVTTMGVGELATCSPPTNTESSWYPAEEGVTSNL